MRRSSSTALGDRVERIPDGETGPRKDWIAWQYGVLAATPGLEPMPTVDRGYLRPQLVRLRASPPSGLSFGPLGYAEAALSSFAIFDRLQREGAVPDGIRFQVSLPTPLAPVTVFVHPADRGTVEPAYEARLLAELGRIVDRIPHDRLAIQWDVAAEVGYIEGVWPAHFPDVEGGVLERLSRIGAAVPDDVPVGYHLCYGDFGHRHFVIPTDARTLVRLANGLARLDRSIAWVHMPVPITWTAPSAYAPFSGLGLSAETRLYLGVVHLADGVEGGRRRIALAHEALPSFGIATECGWGRRPPETVPALLGLHAALSEPMR
jgi:hypothetical protein